MNVTRGHSPSNSPSPSSVIELIQSSEPHSYEVHHLGIQKVTAANHAIHSRPVTEHTKTCLTGIRQVSPAVDQGDQIPYGGEWVKFNILIHRNELYSELYSSIIVYNCMRVCYYNQIGIAKSRTKQTYPPFKNIKSIWNSNHARTDIHPHPPTHTHTITHEHAHNTLGDL